MDEDPTWREFVAGYDLSPHWYGIRAVAFSVAAVALSFVGFWAAISVMEALGWWRP